MKRHWFLGLVILLAIWVVYNLIMHDKYDASLRPLYWLLEQVGMMGLR